MRIAREKICTRYYRATEIVEAQEKKIVRWAFLYLVQCELANLHGAKCVGVYAQKCHTMSTSFVVGI